MNTKVLKEYTLGDMKIRYVMDDESRRVALQMFPVDLPEPKGQKEHESLDSLVHLKIVGDIYNMVLDE